MTKTTKWHVRLAKTPSLCCLHEDALGPWLPRECTAKTLIRLGGCPGWFEYSQGAQVVLLIFVTLKLIFLKLPLGSFFVYCIRELQRFWQDCACTLTIPLCDKYLFIVLWIWKISNFLLDLRAGVAVNITETRVLPWVLPPQDLPPIHFWQYNNESEKLSFTKFLIIFIAILLLKETFANIIAKYIYEIKISLNSSYIPPQVCMNGTYPIFFCAKSVKKFSKGDHSIQLSNGN